MENKPRSYRDLQVWRRSMELARSIYRFTSNLPSEEKFGLVSQLRRAAVSVPSNIAEGQARHTTGEFILAISHAEGSVAEIDTQLQLCVDLGLATASEVSMSQELGDQVRRMLNALRRSLR
jgi:four helix bundle protein